MNTIEWLEEKIKISFGVELTSLRGFFVQAKEMHKIELGKTWDSALDKYEVRAGNYMRAFEDFDDYYQETFKKD